MAKYYRKRRSKTRYARKRSAYKKRTGYRTKRSYRRPLYKRKLNSWKMSRQFMPLTNITKMRYVDTLTLTLTTANTCYYHAFHTNSIYDPDVTSTGHQPSNHDLWMGFYSQYCVIGAKITVKPLHSTTLSNEIWYNVFATDDNTDLPTSGSELWEFKGKPGMAGSWIDDYRKNKKAFFSANKWFKRKVLTDTDCWTEKGYNPNKPVYFYVMACCPAVGSQTVAFAIVIDYTVALRKRVENNSSS